MWELACWENIWIFSHLSVSPLTRFRPPLKGRQGAIREKGQRGSLQMLFSWGDPRGDPGFRGHGESAQNKTAKQTRAQRVRWGFELHHSCLSYSSVAVSFLYSARYKHMHPSGSVFITPNTNESWMASCLFPSVIKGKQHNLYSLRIDVIFFSLSKMRQKEAQVCTAVGGFYQ